MRPSDDDPRVPEELAQGLRGLYAPTAAEREQLDERVRRAARAHFSRPRSAMSGPRALARTWALRAAAVVLALGAWLLWRALEGDGLRTELAQADLDGNGRLDVLDAFQLARDVEQGRARSEWDFDANGRVDRGDADELARRAVRIGS